MGIQEVKRGGVMPEYPNTRKSEQAEGFQERLRQNMKYRNQEKEDIAGAESQAGKVKEKSGMGRIGAGPGIRVNSTALTEALQTVEVKHMSYEESDNVQIAVTEGYTLKGKIQGKEAQVYVEAKYEDGRLEAYQVDTKKVPEKTEHVIERFALETIEGPSSGELE
ncbi:MAG: hypothetical protein HFI62_03465 [Lachnospiraceae bacterium]|jgi:hypothetical protein|nr:hypothetical protein [Lachnospiraceae bacterium]